MLSSRLTVERDCVGTLNNIVYSLRSNRIVKTIKQFFMKNLGVGFETTDNIFFSHLDVTYYVDIVIIFFCVECVCHKKMYKRYT